MRLEKVMPLDSQLATVREATDPLVLDAKLRQLLLTARSPGNSGLLVDDLIVA